MPARGRWRKGGTRSIGTLEDVLFEVEREVMCEEDTKRQIRVLESDQKVREVMEKIRNEKREWDCAKFDKELEEVLSDTKPACEAACKSSGMGGGAK